MRRLTIYEYELFDFAVGIAIDTFINNAVFHDRGWFHYKRGQLVTSIDVPFKLR